MRRTLVRHRWIRWVVIAVAGGVAGLAQLAAAGAVERAAAEWGDTVEVWVADGAHEPGDVLDVESRRLPVAVVPERAVADDPSGRLARQRLVDGEVVVAVDLAPADGPASLAPAGSVVVAVSDPLAAEASAGTSVIVTSEGIVLSSDAVVVGSGEGVVHVAVGAADAPAVAAAASQQLASLLFPAVDR